MAGLDRAVAASPDEPMVLRERGHFHLYFGRPSLARADFDAAARLGPGPRGVRPGRLHADNEPNAIGVTYWAEGHRDLALAFWRYTTRSLLAGRVAYAVGGDGVGSGLLLWFGASRERSAGGGRDDVALVRALFERRPAGRRGADDPDRWPGPLVRFFLGRTDEAAMLAAAAGEAGGGPACEARVAASIRARERGRHATAKRHLSAAVPGNGPQDVHEHYNCWPYFLARHEVGSG